MTPRQIQKQLERERAHANRMNTPLTLSRHDFDTGVRIYVEGWDDDHDKPIYTTDESKALKFYSYDEAKYGWCGKEQIEHYAWPDEVYIHKA